jgi:hypothetical protein
LIGRQVYEQLSPTEPLDDRDGAAAAVHHTRQCRPATQAAQHSTHEYPCHGFARIMVPRKLVPQPVRQTQDPLPDRHVGQHVVDEVRGTFGHSATAAA